MSNTFKWEPKPPAYYHMVLESNATTDKPANLQRDFAHMFVGGKLPQVGDEVRMVCTTRTEEDGQHVLVINLEVVDGSGK